MKASTGFAAADTVLFLEALADRLDRWAAESRAGGWSTHQVEANIRTADECRREAAKLRNAIKPFNGDDQDRAAALCASLLRTV
jgi:hypothetical protein